MVEPWWPLAALAAVQLVDAALCVRPASFVRDCLTDVRFPERSWWMLPPIKVAAAAGLVLGIWLSPLALLTSGMLVLYFVVAITMHLRARDLGRNLFVNATGMLILSGAVFGFVLTQAG
ncbi:DoxX-like protein [Mumia flava]|uniref:DoxX-like protein n=1 Tax=Mumia flava TaxID=1348852 RepID=A0A0B2B6T5_9ACTN|nr:DoxX family protein [Mumia flava]PJJ57706.1 DoxX-like protein [Mumia flava]